MSSNEGGSGFFAGFLIGGLVGAAAALLLSPRTGEETRSTLMETGIELKDRAEVVASKAREEADELLARSKSVLEDQRSKIQEAVEEGKEAASVKKAELLAKYRLARERGEMPLEEPPVAGRAPEVPPPTEEGA